MRRIIALTLADMRFQARYGFYALYLFVSVLYIVILNFFPAAWKEAGRTLTVFSDPAALGLFFIGAILLFEKGENVLPSIAVSPARTGEYVAAKMLSIAVISVLSGIVIMLGSGGSLHPAFVSGVFLGSCLFTLIGICFGARTKTINQFLIITVPAEIVVFLPAIAYFLGFRPPAMLLHPGVLVMCLLDGNPANHTKPLVSILLLALWIAIAFFAARAASTRMFRNKGKEVNP